MTAGTTRARVLVTVKTYPSPSQHHVETVCVAGVRLDGAELSWIRLYPIAFRAMQYADRFKKWQLVEVDISPRGTYDPRPESYRPAVDRLELLTVIDTKKNWAKRRELIAPLIGATTTCELMAANRAVSMSQPAPSLGLIKPRITKVEVFEGEPWTATQLHKAQAAAQGDLFRAPLNELRPPAWRIRYQYRCESTDCKGHKQENADWEVGVASIEWQKRYGPGTSDKMLQRWSTMVADTNDVHFFVGNQHQRRDKFSVLGVWYPKV